MVTGETLQDERINGGALIGIDGLQFPQKIIPVSFCLAMPLSSLTVSELDYV